jgi:hypothetical protein
VPAGRVRVTVHRNLHAAEGLHVEAGRSHEDVGLEFLAGAQRK